MTIEESYMDMGSFNSAPNNNNNNNKNKKDNNNNNENHGNSFGLILEQNLHRFSEGNLTI